MCRRSASCESQVCDRRLTRRRSGRYVCRSDHGQSGGFMVSLPHRTILCITSYEKGQAFMREAKQQGSTVYLLTVEKLRDADWPRDQTRRDFLHALAVQRAGHDLCGELPGAHPPARSDCGPRRLRRGDGRLAARAPAHPRHGRHHRALLPRQAGHARAAPKIAAFACRSSCTCSTTIASATSCGACAAAVGVEAALGGLRRSGIKKINSADEFWPAIDTLGDRQSYYVLEQYVPGNVFHVDSIVSEKEVVFCGSARLRQAAV